MQVLQGLLPLAGMRSQRAPEPRDTPVLDIPQALTLDMAIGLLEPFPSLDMPLVVDLTTLTNASTAPGMGAIQTSTARWGTSTSVIETGNTPLNVREKGK